MNKYKWLGMAFIILGVTLWVGQRISINRIGVLRWKKRLKKQ
jgi:hypothetical protein